MVSLSKHWKHSSGARCLVLLYVLVMGVFSMQPSHGNWLLSSCTRSQKGSDKDKGCHGGSEPGSIPSSCCYLCYVLAAGEFQVCTEAAFWGYWFCSCWIAFPAWFFGPILLGGPAEHWLRDLSQVTPLLWVGSLICKTGLTISTSQVCIRNK